MKRRGAVVRAAGGVVWRDGVDGDLDVLLVHRPRYDDWSFPKGKCDAGEADTACAAREVEEETGVRCELGSELPSASYHDSRGRPKVVRYWVMRPVPEPGSGAAFVANDEVDAVEWLPVAEARRRLTYRRDVELLDAMSDPRGSR